MSSFLKRKIKKNPKLLLLPGGGIVALVALYELHWPFERWVNRSWENYWSVVAGLATVLLAGGIYKFRAWWKNRGIKSRLYEKADVHGWYRERKDGDLIYRVYPKYKAINK